MRRPRKPRAERACRRGPSPGRQPGRSARADPRALAAPRSHPRRTQSCRAPRVATAASPTSRSTGSGSISLRVVRPGLAGSRRELV
jgi:hypothetical protein